jgi:hypothetical protein
MTSPATLVFRFSSLMNAKTAGKNLNRHGLLSLSNFNASTRRLRGVTAAPVRFNPAVADPFDP